MKKIISNVLTAMLVIVAVAAAGDPWKEKPYTQWTMEDVQRILNDSPWVRVAWVDAPWITGQPTYISRVAASCAGRPDFGRPMQPPGATLGPLTKSVVAFHVTWNSARTVKEARVRLAVLCKEMETEQGEELLEKPPDDEYVISMQAPDMRPFEEMNEEALMKNVYLLMRKSKVKVYPSRIIARTGRELSFFGLTTIFNKKTENGAPTIPADEKDIEFTAEAGKTVVKARFNLEKMVNREGRDY